MAITATELKDWLKSRVNSPNWTVGKLDQTKEQTICVYSGLNTQAAVLNVAGSTGSYAPVMFRVLVRWGKGYADATAKANEVFAVLAQGTRTINEKFAHIYPVYNEPISLGTDDKGIYEYAIEIKIICER